MFQTKSCYFFGTLPSDLQIKDLTIINDEVFWLNISTNHLWSLKNGELLYQNEFQHIIPYCYECQTLPFKNHKKCLS